MDQADGQYVKSSSKTVVSSCMSVPMGMRDPMVIGVMDLILCAFFLYSELLSDVFQDSGSKFVCFHGHMQYGNRRSMFLNYSSSERS